MPNTALADLIEGFLIYIKPGLIIENDRKRLKGFSSNLPGLLHRARNIMFSDKAEHNINMSRMITGI